MLRDGPCEEGQDRRVDHMEGDEDEVEGEGDASKSEYSTD